ncbi:phage portal protein [Brevundimonas sp.]|uniref:phage portal protein n=1 Tax=Brevundimonas sp. TaxID=1871086 RepID=UPI0025C2CB8C|nr:phage portal protein [Brevundimonas sp.]
MGFIDGIISEISPAWGARRAANRAKETVLTEARRSVSGRRGYDGARQSRFSRDWRTGGGTADAEISPDLSTLRNRSRDLARNNPYIASAVRQLVANLVGDGIEARAVHADPELQRIAQEVYDEWARSPVDGRHDWYGVQRLAVRTMIEGGDICTVWSERDGIPDARMTLMEGDQLASPLQGLINREPRIQDGVEYDTEGTRAAYHFLTAHPGDPVGGIIRKTRRVSADHVDHMFDATRVGQTRGVPWLCPSIRKVRELQELADAIRTKKRLQACIGIIRTLSADESEEIDDGAEGDVEAGERDTSGSPALERMSPGMVVEGLPGESFTTIQPTADGDSDVFYRQEWGSVAASLGVPEHLMTGDVSKANYSSLRAATVSFWTLLDDWQANIIVPFLLDPAFKRLMRRKALELRQPRLVEVKAEWTPPPRFWVDPVKDVAAQIMEERAGYVNKPEVLARRGINWRSHFLERAMVDKESDRLGLAFDTDPRKINGTGAVQPAAGFILPKAVSEDRSAVDLTTASFFGRMLEAIEAGDHATVNNGFVEAALANRSGNPSGPAMVAIIAALTGADEPENRT